MSKSIQIVGEELTEDDIKSMCSVLERDLIKILSLRDCNITEKGFKKFMKSVGKSQSILQLALNIGIINSELRVQLLTQALAKNQSLTGLFIHGSCIGVEGLKILCKPILQYGRIITLDIGDCQLTDACIPQLCQLITSSSVYSGLRNLSLSANTAITGSGWTEFSLAIASSSLRSLYLDYNKLGDESAACIIVGVTGCGTLQTLDLEGTGVTQKTAKLVLNLVENYSTQLKKVSFSGNKVQKATVEAIKFHLNQSNDDDTENSDADLLSITTRSSLDEPQHTKVKVVTSSGDDEESGNETDRTMQDYSLQSEIVEETENKLTSINNQSSKPDVVPKQDVGQYPKDAHTVSTSSIERVIKGTKQTVQETDLEDYGDELNEVPTYYTGVPITF